MLTDPIILSEASDIAGLWFRHIRGIEDAPALYAVQSASVAHDATDLTRAMEDVPTPAQMFDILSDYTAEGRLDRWLVAEIDGQVVAYTQIESWKEELPRDDVTWVYLHVGWVLPEWRGQGIGTAMLHWAEGFIRGLVSVENPHEKIEFAGNAGWDEKEATTLLLHEGYFVGYTILKMGLDNSILLPPITPLPAEIEIRPALPGHIPLIHSSIEESYLPDPVTHRVIHYHPDVDLAELQYPKHDLSLWLVAWDGDQIVGQVLSVIENGKAEVFQVCVRPPWRRRGIARGLLLRALHDLKARGIADIWLITILEYPTNAKDLYHSVGFRVVKETPRYRKVFKW